MFAVFTVVLLDDITGSLTTGKLVSWPEGSVMLQVPVMWSDNFCSRTNNEQNSINKSVVSYKYIQDIFKVSKEAFKYKNY